VRGARSEDAAPRWLAPGRGARGDASGAAVPEASLVAPPGPAPRRRARVRPRPRPAGGVDAPSRIDSRSPLGGCPAPEGPAAARRLLAWGAAR